MTDTILSKEQAVVLLQKLSSDDKFRASYEASPGEALQAAGIPSEIIKSLPAENLAAHKLNTKEAFAAALQQVRDDAAEVQLCLVVPSVRLNANSGAETKAAAASMPFAAS